MEQPPLPSSISWFAPWRWKRRWWLLMGLLLAGYPLSIFPSWALVERGMMLEEVYFTLYAPVIWLLKRNEAVLKAVEWFSDLVDL